MAVGSSGPGQRSCQLGRIATRGYLQDHINDVYHKRPQKNYRDGKEDHCENNLRDIDHLRRRRQKVLLDAYTGGCR